MRFQWAQLIVLMLLHAMIDMFAGFMPAVLPQVRDRFGLSLTIGVALLTALNIATNVMQIATGHLRGNRSRPLFMPAAFILGGATCLIYFVPVSGWALPLLFAFMIAAGAGVAVFHPESMRAIHAMDRIPSSVTTPFLIMGGYYGYCGGAWIGAVLVEKWQFAGLLGLLPLAGLGLILVLAMRYRLAVDDQPAVVMDAVHEIPFWKLFVMAVPVCTGMTIIVSLLPSHLHLLGFKTSWGGFASFLFGAGVGISGVVWGLYARRKGELRVSVMSLLLCVPFMLAFVLLARHKAAVVLLVLCGLCAGGGYPMLVSLARRAGGLTLGSRMAFMVGGVWGIASLVLLALGPLADFLEVHYRSLTVILHLAWVCYLVSAVFGVWVLKADRRRD